jgi:hypothetical protein
MTNFKSIMIALLIVFALGGVVNKDTWFGADRAIGRTVNKVARWGLRYALFKRLRKVNEVEVQGVIQEGEIDHRSSL